MLASRLKSARLAQVRFYRKSNDEFTEEFFSQLKEEFGRSKNKKFRRKKKSVRKKDKEVVYDINQKG